MGLVRLSDVSEKTEQKKNDVVSEVLFWLYQQGRISIDAPEPPRQDELFALLN